MLCRGVLQTPLQIASLHFAKVSCPYGLSLHFAKVSHFGKVEYKFKNNENQKDDIFIFIVSYYFLSNRSSVVVSESVLRKNR